MPETSIPTPPGFDALSKAEQVRYLQKLWDQISEDPDRLKRFREDPSRSHSAFDVLDRLADTSSADSKSK